MVVCWGWGSAGEAQYCDSVLYYGARPRLREGELVNWEFTRGWLQQFSRSFILGQWRHQRPSLSHIDMSLNLIILMNFHLDSVKTLECHLWFYRILEIEWKNGFKRGPSNIAIASMNVVFQNWVIQMQLSSSVQRLKSH